MSDAVACLQGPGDRKNALTEGAELLKEALSHVCPAMIVSKPFEMLRKVETYQCRWRRIRGTRQRQCQWPSRQY